MRISVTLILLCAFGFAQANEHKAQAKPETTITRNTELVVVPVVVQRDGKHVPGLKSEQFRVLQDGKPQKIAVFEEVGATRAPAPTKLPAGVYSNVVTSAPRRLVIVVIDALNTPFLDQSRGRAALLRYVAQKTDDGASIALVLLTRSGLRILQDFTMSPQRLMRALNAAHPTGDADSGPVRARPSSSSSKPELEEEQEEKIADEDEIDSDTAAIDSFLKQTDAGSLMSRVALQTTLEAFRGIANAFAGLPGRKSLVWLTGGLPPGPESSSLVDEYRRTWRALNDANVAVYSVDAREIDMGRAMHGMPITSRVISERALSEDLLRTMSHATGGTAFVGAADGERAIAESLNDSAAYYTIAFYRDPNENKPGWHKLDVKTTVKDVRLRHRNGFFVGPTADADDSPQNVETKLAVASPVEFTAVPILFRWGQAGAGDGGKQKVRFHLVVPPEGIRVDEADSNHMKVQIVGVLRDSKGQPAGDFVQTLESRLTAESLRKLRASGLVYSNTFDAPPGEYTATMVVRDALAGRIGSVVAPLTVK